MDLQTYKNFSDILKAFSVKLPDGRLKELCFSTFQELQREMSKNEPEKNNDYNIATGKCVFKKCGLSIIGGK